MRVIHFGCIRGLHKNPASCNEKLDSNSTFGEHHHVQDFCMILYHFTCWLTLHEGCFGSSISTHCMKSGIFVSMQHCRLTWNFRFATARGNLQATPKTAVNCRKLTQAFSKRSPRVQRATCLECVR